MGTLVWQQLLCGYSLVFATKPCLKGFLGRFLTEDLARVFEGSSDTRICGQNSGIRTNIGTYVLDSLHRKSSRRPPNDKANLLACHPGDMLHSATAYAETFGDNGEGYVNSFAIERMMIYPKVEYGMTFL